MKLLNETKVFFSETLKEAEDKVIEVKELHGEKVTKTIIEKRKRKTIEFYMTTITISFDTYQEITDEIAELYCE